MDVQSSEDKTLVIQGVLPEAVVEAIVVPYRPIHVPFRSSVYQTLSVERRDIRILEVTHFDPIRWNLVRISLNDKPHYAALSNEGNQLSTSSLDEGSKGGASPIESTNSGNVGHLELNGHRFTCAKSVLSAIREFYAAARDSGNNLSGKALRLWVADLCINLANSSEREQQVQINKEIHSNAKVVWIHSNNLEDAAVVTSTDSNDMTPVISNAKPSKPTTLASPLPAQLGSRDIPATVLEMPDFTKAFQNFLPFDKKEPPILPQPAAINYSSQLFGLDNDLSRDASSDGVYPTTMVKISVKSFRKETKHGDSSHDSNQDRSATPMADSNESSGDGLISTLPRSAILPKASKSLYETGAVQRTELLRQYKYQPIKTEREIRLLQIDKHPLGLFNTAKCSLIRAQLGDPSYPYNAVSYTWGDSNPTRSLKLDCEQGLRVTNNVWLLIDFLFKDMNFGTSYFWIDALCINQVDLKEKSAQVSLMQDIYQHASVVIIWLGELDGGYEEDAMKDLQRLERFFKLYDENKDKYGVILSNRAKQNAQSHSSSSGAVWMKEVAPDGRVRMRRPEITDMLRRHMTPALIEARFRLHYGNELPTDWNWGQISMLLSKPWFERVWVIQEAFAGSKVLVHCGTNVMSWEELVFVASRLIHCGLDESVHHGTGENYETLIKTVPTGLKNSVLIYVLKLVEAEKKALRLTPLLLVTSRYQATNPRDKVYVLLGISSKDGRSALVPDYSLSVEEVFVNTAVHLIREDDSLELLAAAGIGWHRETPNLPSWVPDFRCPPELPNWRFMLYNDSPTTPSNKSKHELTAKVIPSTNSLIVSGCLVDEVVWVCPLPCPQSQTAKSDGAASYEHNYSIDNTKWFSQTKMHCKYLHDYPTKEPIDEVYWRTLIMNSTHKGYPAIAEYGASFKRHEFRLGNVAKYHEVHKKERVDLAILMSDLAHHEKEEAVSAELAYMQRVHQASELELERRWYQAYATNGAGRNAFITSRGYFGIAAPGIAVHDHVAYLQRLLIPMILRDAKSSWRSVPGQLEPKYHLVSESYIHGLMLDEYLGADKMRDICLC